MAPSRTSNKRARESIVVGIAAAFGTASLISSPIFDTTEIAGRLHVRFCLLGVKFLFICFLVDGSSSQVSISVHMTNDVEKMLVDLGSLKIE